MRKQLACSSLHHLLEVELHIALNSGRSKAEERQRYILLCHICGLAKATTALQKKSGSIAADMALFTYPIGTLGGCFVRFSQ